MERIRADQRAFRCDLDGERIERRGEQRLPGADKGGEKHEQPDLRTADEQRGGQRGLSAAPERIGAEHHRPASEAVGEHPACQDEDHLRDYPRRGDVAQVRGRPATAEHGEDGRHTGHRGTEQRSHVAGVETAEIALP